MRSWSLLCLAAAIALTTVGLRAGYAADNKADAKIKANLAKLSPEDQKLAEAQKWCAIEEENLLGSMGKPVKIELKGEPVFLCCKGCLKAAKKDPDGTLKKAHELKEKAASAK
jgi:hypothetical protein